MKGPAYRVRVVVKLETKNRVSLPPIASMMLQGGSFSFQAGSTIVAAGGSSDTFGTWRSHAPWGAFGYAMQLPSRVGGICSRWSAHVRRSLHWVLFGGGIRLGYEVFPVRHGTASGEFPFDSLSGSFLFSGPLELVIDEFGFQTPVLLDEFLVTPPLQVCDVLTIGHTPSVPHRRGESNITREVEESRAIVGLR